MDKTFQPPEIWDFPPFFTIQPIEETRKKQLELWKQLILEYHCSHSQYQMTISSFPYFRNEKIDRTLSTEGISLIINYLINSRNAEWTDNTKTSLNIFYKAPETIADSLYKWVVNKGLVGSVLTVFELCSAEEHPDSVVLNIDPLLVRKSLLLLQAKGKCAIIQGAIVDEDGVKFL